MRAAIPRGRRRRTGRRPPWGPALVAAGLLAAAMTLPPGGAEAAAACRGRPATITGTPGDDHLVGTPGPDVIAGLGGNDVIEGRGGRDVICGGDGDDVLRGGAGADILDGGAGDDRIEGGAGPDLLVGGGGADRLSGGRDGDLLFGGPGADRLVGGGGADGLFGGPGRDRADGGPGLDACRAERQVGCGAAVAPACPAGVGCGLLPGPGVLDVPLVVTETSGAARQSAPVTSGLPIPQVVGLTSTTGLRILDAAGRAVPAQFAVLARWGGAPGDPSAPIRWLLADFQADVAAGGRAAVRLVGSGGAAPAAPPLAVEELPGSVVVDTGAARFEVSRGDGRLDGPGLAAPVGVRLTRRDGTTAGMRGPVEVSVAATGPMRAVVEVSGSLRTAGGQAVLGYRAEYWFYAGRPEVRLFLTVENRTPCPLGADGQISCHDLGSAGSRSFSDLSLVLPAAPGAGARYVLGGQARDLEGDLDGPLLLHQGSSGTGHWDHYATLTDWEGTALDARPRLQAYAARRGYRATLGGEALGSGDHAAGHLAVGGAAGWWAVQVAGFWEQFPKSLRAAAGGTIEVGLFPEEYGPEGFAYTLRAGEQKTHEVWLRWSGAGVPEGGGALTASAPASWYVASGAAGHTALPGAWAEHEAYLAAQLDRAPGFLPWMDWFEDLPAAVEETDFYGITDYGDWPIDYEGFLVSPLNLKYDAGWGLWLQWMRTGDPRWRELAEAGNRHFADADVLHTLHDPRHWSDGIAFGHSYHDETGFENAHRNYGGTHPDTAFGPEGLLLTYYLTGYDPARRAALEVADCIEYRLGNDVHLCPYLDGCSGEWWALEEGLYSNGERPAGNALSIVVEAYRATGEERFRRAAEALVTWAAAGAQPYIGGPDGTDRWVKPWALGLYLRALADWLEVLDEFGLPDDAGARASYLAYADWLLDEALTPLPPIASGDRAAFPYEWWLDGRAENDVPDVTSWLLLGADALAYAHHLSGDDRYLEAAEALFRAGSHDPWFEGDLNTYSSTKETANAVTWGNTFLWEWAAAGG